MKNTYGDADAKDTTEISLEKDLAALRAENEFLKRELDNAKFQAANFLKAAQEKSAENAKLRAIIEGIFKASDSDGASGGEMWYAEVVEQAIQKAKEALNSTTPDPLYLASPEMLEALTLVDNLLKHAYSGATNFAVVEKAKVAAAIAKAKGEQIPSGIN